MQDTLLEIKNLKTYFPIHGGIFLKKVGDVMAVNDVSFEVKKGETLGLVGESGCGKTTLGRTITRLYNPTEGKIHFNGQDISTSSLKSIRTLRKDLQMIFQDPYESLNIRHTIRTILEEPFIIHKIGSKSERFTKIQGLLEKVGLPSDILDRFPHEFSGGQRQRIGIARAIALNPKMIICDEPVSALDVSIQSQILNLLLDLQTTMNLTYLFIAHDLAVVKHISDRVAVMYLGKIVELTDADLIYTTPLHPYTQALIKAIPVPDPHKKDEKKEILKGEIPSPSNPPSGCFFRTRCPHVMDICKTKTPELKNYGKSSEHLVSCHLMN